MATSLSDKKKALKEWDEYRKALITGTALEYNKTTADIEKHRKYLEARPAEWCKYMFPNYATADFAPFHLAYIKRIVEHDEWYEVNSWSRELAKDSRSNPLSDFNLHTDKARGPHYHVTPGKFPHIIGGYWGVMEAKNRPGRRPPPAG